MWLTCCVQGEDSPAVHASSGLIDLESDTPLAPANAAPVEDLFGGLGVSTPSSGPQEDLLADFGSAPPSARATEDHADLLFDMATPPPARAQPQHDVGLGRRVHM